MSKDAAPGAKRLSLRDVARQAKVAVSTVSRVLSDHPDVSTATKQRVMAVVEELGYRPNAVGRMLRQGATLSVGFAIGDISNPLLSQIALGAETVLGEHGYSLLLSNSMNDAERELENLRTFEQRRVDGLLLSVTDERDPQLSSLFERFDGPMVAIDREIASASAISAVNSDHRGGIARAVAALAHAGHERFAIITGLARLRPGRERVQAAETAAKHHGLRCVVASTELPAGPASAEIAALLRDTDPPTAVIAGNNQVLAGALEAFNETGLSYPEDISIVTCDEVSLQRFITPRIATIRRDPYRLGQVSAQLLLERLLDSSAEPRRVEMPTEFDAGMSIAAPRSAN
ncbi:MAG: LacI family DNA-binding transcriptional regulator [Stackebrandtia sp.]